MFDKDIELKGKHATYVKFLNAHSSQQDKSKGDPNIFATAIDVYMIAALIGVSYNIKSQEDKTSSDGISIFVSAFKNHFSDIEIVYRLVFLSEKSTDLSDNEKIERAFKFDEDPEKFAENMILFHQYVRGGIEWLYEQIKNATTKEDYLEKINEIISLYMKDFSIGN
ncbi:MAG: hypothetical protein LBT51_03145 [Fusobacteriaceae bacterium]|jgi:hypothetical protein|nr:hypothetical protein [Fusobacteriaceae bacterium]